MTQVSQMSIDKSSPNSFCIQKVDMLMPTTMPVFGSQQPDPKHLLGIR
jgi:hypothetical protein